LEDSTEAYFFFTTPKKDGFIYSNNIPKVYDVDVEIYDDLVFELYDVLEKLREEFKKNEQELWKNLTLILHDSGKFKIE
ncbi:immunity protein YezG family protein, partial [Vibrio vulnificus]|uniref:immunity protein YezG family protein n=1 Tax=Vibrio vulnificus TaxID=672 RepID=UPI0039B61B2D